MHAHRCACRYALPQQAAMTLALLLFNHHLCRTNVAIQLAYAGVQARLASHVPRIVARLLAAGGAQPLPHPPAPASSSCVAGTLAAPSAEAAATACSSVEDVKQAALPPVPASQAAAGAAGDGGTQLCLHFQPLRCGQASPLLCPSPLCVKRAQLQHTSSCVGHACLFRCVSRLLPPCQRESGSTAKRQASHCAGTCI